MTGEKCLECADAWTLYQWLHGLSRSTIDIINVTKVLLNASAKVNLHVWAWECDDSKIDTDHRKPNFNDVLLPLEWPFIKKYMQVSKNGLCGSKNFFFEKKKSLEPLGCHRRLHVGQAFL